MNREVTVTEQQRRHIAAEELLHKYREEKRGTEGELPYSMALLAVCREADAEYYKAKYDDLLDKYKNLESHCAKLQQVCGGLQ